jgi:hypothetical protein
MKPQTILVNVILAIVLSAGVLMLIDAGGVPPASEQGTAAQQDSTQRESTERSSTPSGNTSGGSIPSGSTERGNPKTGTAQPGSTRAAESPSHDLRSRTRCRI